MSLKALDGHTWCRGPLGQVCSECGFMVTGDFRPGRPGMKPCPKPKAPTWGEADVRQAIKACFRPYLSGSDMATDVLAWLEKRRT